MQLPVYSKLDEILKTVDSNRITIIKGPTGCGKSTVVPAYLSDKYTVAVIQPRRLAAVSLYNTIKNKTLKLENLNKSVGYKIRFNKKNTDAQLVFYTDGMFLHETRIFDVIIIDEVHERTIRMDVIMALYKKYQKLVLMSATVDISELQIFFGTFSLVEISGQPYPMKIFYENQPVADYIFESFTKIREIVSLKPKTDILVFLPGEEDINDLFALLRPVLNVQVLKVHSQLSDRMQQLIFEPSSLIKVILSTNICETSLTIPNIGYVIDTGLYKTKISVLKNGFIFNSLCINEISKDSSDQRAGRSNRTGEGVVYRLYTLDKYSKLGKSQPEISRTDINSTLLYLINNNINIFDLNLVTYPYKEMLMAAFSFLFELKLIKMKKKKFLGVENAPNTTNKKKDMINNIFPFFKISTLGGNVAFHPFPAHISYFFQHCIKRGIQNKGAVLVSFLGLENQLPIPRETHNDISYLLEAFKINDDSAFMKKAKRIYESIKGDDLSDYNIEKAFSEAFSYNLGIRQSDGSYLHKSGLRFFARSKEQRIVFDELICFGKTYARVCGKFYGEL